MGNAFLKRLFDSFWRSKKIDPWCCVAFLFCMLCLCAHSFFPFFSCLPFFEVPSFLIFFPVLLFLLLSLCGRNHFVEWSRVIGHLAYTGNRRGLLLACMRRWSNSVACLKAAKWSTYFLLKRQKKWTKDVVAPYEEKIRRLEFQLAEVDQSKQSDSKEKHMLHAYLSHSAQRNVFALDVIKQLRRKLT